MSPTPCPSTLTLKEASDRLWDLLVVGAGPAGALAARQASRRGVSVLLVDKAPFPRRKVCGCCLNRAALHTLNSVGLGDLPSRMGGRPLQQLLVAAGARRAFIPLPGGLALSRESLDAALVEEAIRAGADFLPQTYATLRYSKENRQLHLKGGNEEGFVEGKVLIVADGLGGGLLQKEETLKARTTLSSRIGGGAVTGCTPSFYRAGTVFMACGLGGYVGLVQLEDGRLDIAASFDAAFVREQGGLGPAAAEILHQARLPLVENLELLEWHGTPALTRRRVHVAADRLFVIGDAAGYVEPFTGEGIAWALTSAEAVVPLAIEAIEEWDPLLAARWDNLHCRLISQRQYTCRFAAWFLRQSTWVQMATAILSKAPHLLQPLVECVNAPLQQGV